MDVAETDYEAIKAKFAEARDLRLKYRPEGTSQYTSDLTGALAKYAIDPYADDAPARAPITDTVECLFIGGGFSALLTAALDDADALHPAFPQARGGQQR